MTGGQPLYAIVGGTTKAGTTSLFRYLSAHPNVCGASMKETRYFLDQDYPLPRRFHSESDAIARYYAYFSNCMPLETLRVEATPDYLHGERCARNIQNSLPNARLIFTLRNPVDRACSWYRFGIQNGLLDAKLDFADFVNRQLSAQEENERRSTQIDRVVYQGRYANYLRRFYSCFSSSQIHILLFEDLKANPAEEMRRLCLFLNLDDQFYNDYDFRRHNQTKAVRSGVINNRYRASSRWIRSYIHDQVYIRSALRATKSVFDKVYNRINFMDDGPGEIPVCDSATRAELEKFYRPSIKELVELTNCRIGWEETSSNMSDL